MAISMRIGLVADPPAAANTCITSVASFRTVRGKAPNLIAGQLRKHLLDCKVISDAAELACCELRRCGSRR
jgi:hypothetical protein